MSFGGPGRGPPPPGGAGGGRSFLSLKIDEKKRMQESVSGHRTGLPDRLLRLFAPRPPLPPHQAPPRKPPKLPYTGVAQYLQHFAAPGDPEYEPPPPETQPPGPRIFRSVELQYQARLEQETKVEKDVRLREERQRAAAEQHEEAAKSWDPSKDPSVQGDPFRTLFVGRLSYDVTERKLRREFEEWGPIKSLRLVHDKNSGKPRGYAFIEYERKEDMKQAYKLADGRKVEDRRVAVDVERGRTVPAWRPRRLGGGKGGESRIIARPPKDLKKQFVARIVERAMAERESGMRREAGERGGGGGGEERERERPRDRSRGEAGGGGGALEEGETREAAARDYGGGRREERSDRGDRDRRSSADHRGSDRDRDRDYRDRERGGRDDGGYRKRERDDYREGGRSGGDDYRGSRGGYDSYDRDSKRPRERDI